MNQNYNFYIFQDKLEKILFLKHIEYISNLCICAIAAEKNKKVLGWKRILIETFGHECQAG